jgi:hypothetical protein
MPAGAAVSSQWIAGSIAGVMGIHNSGPRTLALGAVAVAMALGLWAASTDAAAPAGCASFSSQAVAQERFASLNGNPSRDVAALDADGDGVACEGLPGPYEGFATIGYNLKRGFFYGTASMPVDGAGSGFACMSGNRHFPDGPRQLKIYRARPGPDLAVSRVLAAEARQSSGRLLWKLEAPLGHPARYYAVFEEEVRLSPYRPTECPGFSSSETRLPRPKP